MKRFTDYHPDVSIILATYNRSNIISASIESVLQQSFVNWELLIVDDGSTDETYQVIKNYLKDKRLVYIRHSHKNLPLTRNSGIQASKGDYITFIDSDDMYQKDHILIRVNILNENPDVDLLYGGYQIIGNPYVIDKNDHSKLIHLDQCYIGGTFFGKRNVFIELEGFRDLLYSEDSDFMERALLKFKVNKINFPTYIYCRESADSICNTI